MFSIMIDSICVLLIAGLWATRGWQADCSVALAPAGRRQNSPSDMQTYPGSLYGVLVICLVKGFFFRWTKDSPCQHAQPHAAPIQPAAVHSCAPTVAPGALHRRLLLLAQPPELQHLQLLLVQLGHQPL